ncbi:AAA family ATPase [Citrobacter gillenii]|jgi:predicted kinase|uniref:AAA family ATPase n=1 Tax=Citrobacter gillenii TaxID=67828 RepID=UPI00311CC353
MLIIFSGLPGSGKSTIAQALAKKLNAVYLRIDTIEQAIREAENEEREMGPQGYFVAYNLARENLKMGATVIADSVNPLAITRDAYRDVALSGGSDYLEIEVVCTDQVQHHKQVEQRKPEVEGLSLPDWNDVTSLSYETWDRERLILDSAKLSVSQSVEMVIEALNG